MLCFVQAALNLDASVSRLGFYGEQQEHLWCLSHTDTLHLWDWQTACDEEAEGSLNASIPSIYAPATLFFVCPADVLLWNMKGILCSVLHACGLFCSALPK